MDVYLKKKLSESELNNLIISSGDFGLAYLSEGWAARFVGELFRNYVICFIGYSLNDPTLRYMMDALAADQILGEDILQTWAFGDCEPGEEEYKSNEWKAKGVTPILYHVKAGSHDHSKLHNTLKAWGDTYQAGSTGAESIVTQYALAHPSASTQQDDYIGRMLWAMSDPSGQPAKCFATFQPTPPLEWLLEVFSKENHNYSDLKRSGIPLHIENKGDSSQPFSLINRPSPRCFLSNMQLAGKGRPLIQYDKIMSHLAEWLADNYLNDSRLVLWIYEQGGQLSENFKMIIENRLEYLKKLEIEKDTNKLDDIRRSAPNAIPCPEMQILWSIICAGQLKTSGYTPRFFQWTKRVKLHGLTASIRQELRELLSIKIELRKNIISLVLSKQSQSQSKNIKLEYNFVFNTGVSDQNILSSLPKLIGLGNFVYILDDFQILLCDALDLQRDLNAADDRNDKSFIDIPSIIPHPQNRNFHEWVLLIELVRDTWLTIRKKNIDYAIQIAKRWFDLPYLTFKRLALYAASQEEKITPEQWIKWLLADDAFWLWSGNIKREVLRLLVLQGRKLSSSSQEYLETAILSGPPQSIFKTINIENRPDIKDRDIWLRLAKLQSSGLVLGSASAKQLKKLSQQYPEWQLAPDERDEFGMWMSSPNDPEFKEVIKRYITPVPRELNALIRWLNHPPPENNHLYDDEWYNVCRTRFALCLRALSAIANQNSWPILRWKHALQAWNTQSMARHSWKFVIPLVQKMPDKVLFDLRQEIAYWLMVVANFPSKDENVILKLCMRFINLENTHSKSNFTLPHDYIIESFDHYIGHITEAILKILFHRKPNDNDKIPKDITPLFAKLCNTNADIFCYGRVILCSHLVAFFRIDPKWSKQHLLPMLDWEANHEVAKAAWTGFLLSPRLYSPLLRAFKKDFLDTAKHYNDLGSSAQEFATFLTYSALDINEGYTTNEFRSAFKALPQQGLEKVASALIKAIKGAGEQAEEYWKHRIQPFWRNIWPKSLDLVDEKISIYLAQLVIATRDEFPNALRLMKDWLQPVSYIDFIPLQEAEFCNKFPKDTLTFLNSIINGPTLHNQHVENCLEKIVQFAPTLAEDKQYKRLKEYCRQSQL